MYGHAYFYSFILSEPPTLIASLDIKFITSRNVTEDAVVDKESDVWKWMENEVYTKVCETRCLGQQY